MSSVIHTVQADRPRNRSVFAGGLIFGVVVLAAAVTAIVWMHHRDTPTLGGPFELINATTGQQVTDAAFRGKWLLIFFGYTHCPDVCPTTLSNMTEALKQLGPLAQQVQALFITVDPQRDTPQMLADYTAAFDSRIIGLTGSLEHIDSAASAYGMYYAKRLAGDDYYMDHTAAIHVMRTDG